MGWGYQRWENLLIAAWPSVVVAASICWSGGVVSVVLVFRIVEESDVLAGYDSECIVRFLVKGLFLR